MVLEKDQRKYRVVDIDGRTQNTWIIDIYDDNWAIPWNSNELQTQVDSGEIKPVVDPFGSLPVIADDSPSSLVQTRRYALLKPYVQDIRKLLTKRERSSVIASIPGTSRQTSTFLLKQYLKRGMTREALRPDFERCGHWMDEKREENLNGIAKRDPEPEAKKVGAPRTVAKGIGINVNKEVRRQLIIGADLWLSSRTVTLGSAINYVVETYYSQKVLDPATGDEVIKAERDLKPTE